jgi:sec-independent protein translocase protein TatB
MFGVDTSELLLIAVIALVFIGPKDLPRAMRTVGHWVGKVRGMARHFNSGIEAMVREAELEEMEKQWREENERIMREFPGNPDVMLPGAAAANLLRATTNRPCRLRSPSCPRRKSWPLP